MNFLLIESTKTVMREKVTGDAILYTDESNRIGCHINVDHGCVLKTHNAANKKPSSFKRKLIERWEQDNAKNQKNFLENVNNNDGCKKVNLYGSEENQFLIKTDKQWTRADEKEIVEKFVDESYKNIIEKENNVFQRAKNPLVIEISINLMIYKTSYKKLIEILSMCEKVYKNFCLFANLPYYDVEPQKFTSNNGYEMFLYKMSIIIGNLEHNLNKKIVISDVNVQAEADEFGDLIINSKSQTIVNFVCFYNKNHQQKDFEFDQIFFEVNYTKFMEFVLHELRKLNLSIDNVKTLLFLIFFIYETDEDNDLVHLKKQRDREGFLHEIYTVLVCANRKIFHFSMKEDVETYIHKILVDYFEINGVRMSFAILGQGKRRIKELNRANFYSSLFNLDNYYLIRLLFDLIDTQTTFFYRDLFSSDWNNEDFKEEDPLNRLKVHSIKLINRISDIICKAYLH